MRSDVTRYTIGRQLHASFPDAVQRVRQALSDQGFGIITEIDMMQTFKAKRGIDYHPYVILGACNPDVAHRALAIDQDIGVLLPCNVVIRETAETPGSIVVSAIDPVVQLGVTDNAQLVPHAEEIRERLRQALDAATTES